MLTHLDLFSGIGGFALASQMVGDIKTMQFIEIEPYCQEVLAKNFPGVPIHGDITTFVAAPGGYDLVTAGWPCFVAGTMILTIEGYKPIETLRLGELVLTHKGQWQPILKLMVKRNAPLREIRALGVHSLITTDEHPFYVVKRTAKMQSIEKTRYEGRTFRKQFYFMSKPEWIKAENLTTKHYVGQVLPPEILDNHSPEFWEMVGLYLADGWSVKRLDRPGYGRVVICANKKQASEVESRILNAGFHYSKREERTVFKYHIFNKDLYLFLEQFGSKANGKHIPGWVLGLEPNKAKALLEGLIFGDGWTNSRGYTRITTVSQGLAYSVALLAQRAYGCIASVFHHVLPKTTWIEGRLVNQQPQFIVQISFANTEKRSYLDEGYGWKRIRSNKSIRATATVYNLTVDRDNSYIANGAIVHNCQDLSYCNPNGKGLAGKRSGLFFEVMRLIRQCRPRYIVLENVPALLSKHNGRDMGTVLWELSQSGYDAEWQIVSAAQVGAPHLRERVFIVGYSNSLRRRRQGMEQYPGTLFSQGSQTKPEADTNSHSKRLEEWNRSQPETWSQPTLDGCSWWSVEPGVDRVASRIPNRMDRIKGLGNAVVPQVAAIPLRRILEIEGKPERVSN